MIGWTLLGAAAVVLVGREFLINGVDGGLLAAGVAFLLLGIWRRIDETHEIIHHWRLTEQRAIDHD